MCGYNPIAHSDVENIGVYIRNASHGVTKLLVIVLRTNAAYMHFKCNVKKKKSLYIFTNEIFFLLIAVTRERNNKRDGEKRSGGREEKKRVARL